MSTLLVSTVYPEEGRESTFVEVATIRSPYSFTFEDGMSTRYEPIFTIQSLNVDAHYRDRLKGLYVVARNFFLLLLNFSAWPCLAVA